MQHPIDQQLTVTTTPVTAIARIETFEPLTKYDDQDFRQPDHLACISAGFKGDNGSPVVSRDGTIHLHDPEGRADGLAAILAANEGRRLTIAMPSNNPADFIGQSFRLEGRARLEAYGDAKSITVIRDDGTRDTYAAGTADYNGIKARCKVTTNITFLLAEYDEQGQPRLIFPDGLGAYRIRTTSHRTLKNLLEALKLIQSFTGGPVAGIPLEARLVYRNVADSKGAKRNVPLFTFVVKPPHTIQLSTRTFRPIAEQAQLELSCSLLELPAPESIDLAIADFETLEPEMNDTAFRGRWFAMVKGTELEDAEARATFIRAHTNGRTDSLATFLSGASYAEACALIDAAERHLGVAAVDLETGEVITVEAELVEDEPAPAALASDEIVAAIGSEMKRVGWTPAGGQAHLLKAYQKRTRAELTQGQAQEFLEHLGQLPAAAVDGEAA